MADTGSYSLGFRLDIKQILFEAQHRWLRPAEICEILRNYQKFHISPEPPNKPISGSVFLFDRKVLRYFRKDGHNWRKKKDGKTVKEAHEKLKVGSVDMLHCYYAHGEDNENFQRRSYWLLEQDFMHIVFVHYLEVKGNRTNASYAKNVGEFISNSDNGASLSSSFHETYGNFVPINASSTSPTSTLTSANEDAESEDTHQASSRLHSFPESPSTDDCCTAVSTPYGEVAPKQETGPFAAVQANMQYSFEDNLHSPTMNQKVIMDAAHYRQHNLCEEKLLHPNHQNVLEPFYLCTNDHKEQSEQRELQMLFSGSEIGNWLSPNFEAGMTTIQTENHPFLLKKPLINGLQVDESLKKVDSFSRWIAKELGEVDELEPQSTTGISWSIIGGEDDASMVAQLQEDSGTLSPSLSQDQLFSIIDFSPNWAYLDLETKVLISGTFLKSEAELNNCKWSVMFGELEVPAEVLADGRLVCKAPPHKPGVVPFYITCSNRLACSEVREFEYRLGPTQLLAGGDLPEGQLNEMQLLLQLEMLLSLGHVGSTFSSLEIDVEKQEVINKIVSLMDEEKHKVVKVSSENANLEPKVMEALLLENQLKEKFYSWLLHKVLEGEKGAGVLDEKGQSVLHLVAALGYDWALQPILASGISIDFRDANGWTALHWAASCGREDTVVALVSLGAAPGALTDPSAEHPLGRTPADLASASGHKGISGFLAENSLTAHLSSLKVNEPDEDGASDISGVKAIQTASERVPIPTTEEDVPDVLSLKDSLAAVCNATQAAARIHQIFRIQSFQRKQYIEHGCDDLSTSDEDAISLLAANTCKSRHAAAVHIQKKFRGWKKRKEFLFIRQKVVKIQAHVRGHQVRKKYKPIVWSVGILEKVILRWRRKGPGLRGFRSDGAIKGPAGPGTQQSDDDYDFLKEGRKQTEERLQKALARVKSMAQSPDARAQYRRLLTAAEGLRETKVEAIDMIQDSSGDVSYCDEELLDVDSLLDDETFMSLAFQ